MIFIRFRLQIGFDRFSSDVGIFNVFRIRLITSVLKNLFLSIEPCNDTNSLAKTGPSKILTFKSLTRNQSV